MSRIGEGPTNGARGSSNIGTTFIAMNALSHFPEGVAGGMEGAETKYKVGASGDK